MKTLYLCGAGNSEGVRLALTINRITPRWDRLVILDDDPGKLGQEMLGIEILGGFDLLAQAQPETVEVSIIVALTTAKRRGAKK